MQLLQHVRSVLHFSRKLFVIICIQLKIHRVGHRVRRKPRRLSSNDPIETAPAEGIGLNPASSAGAVPKGT